MIITVTLNPAIDHTLVLPKFVAGDTIRVKSVRSDPGGKGINVSRVIHELGGESLAMGFAPGGLGRYIEQTLNSQGIPCDFLHTKGEVRTNITILDESRHMNTILSHPGPDGARQVHDSGVNQVVVTRGREGALAVADSQFLRGVAPRVRAVSAVGSGDAFLAGVVLTLSKGGDMKEALRLGIASGTASVLFPGTELCRRREVDILMPRVRVQPIEHPVAC